jgi:hypothetical protein
MIKIVTVRMGQWPQVEEIDGSLESMQAIVGGFVEATRPVGLLGLDLFCNEDGVSLGLLPNGCGILGDYFFIRHDDNGDPVSLTDEDLATIRNYYRSHRLVIHPSLLEELP